MAETYSRPRCPKEDEQELQEALHGARRLTRNSRKLLTEGEHYRTGPVQLIVLGFDHPEFHGEIIAELERLRESDTVRVIDALAVYKDAEGEIEVEHLSNLTQDEAIELGSKVGALIGLGIEGEEGMEAGADRAPRRPPTASRSSPTRRPGTSSRRSRTTRRPR